MTAANDKVTKFNDNVSSLAGHRAVKAMAEYEAGIADSDRGRHRAIQAIIDYGTALLEGREGRSNKAFSQWVSANKLDIGTPWSDVRERSTAMKIATIFGSVPKTTFDACPHTRPIDIMKWYRKATRPKGEGKSSRRREVYPPKTDPVVQREAALLFLDKNYSREEAVAEFGLKHNEVQLAIERERGRRETLAELLDPAACAHFTEKSKLRVEDKIHILEKQFERRLNDAVRIEVRRQIDAADDAMRAENKRLRAQVLSLERIVGERGVFTKAQFRQMQMLCHPDSSASEKTKAELSQILIDKEIRLVKPDK